MKTVILCGGQGTRMKEETEFKPKPLVLVGGRPLLWHIMKIYSHYGYNEFILALGYKGDMIKEHFLRWRSIMSDFTLDTGKNEVIFHNNECDDFKITFVETGEESLTGERVRQVKDYIDGDDFMVTYGDGVGNVDIKRLVELHKQQDTVGTITAINPISRFGLLKIDHDNKKITDFRQKSVKEHENNSINKNHVNGGFMVFKKEFIDMIDKDSMIESALLKLADKNELSVNLHKGQWKCMDTYKEVEELNDLWKKDPFWKVWN